MYPLGGDHFQIAHLSLRYPWRRKEIGIVGGALSGVLLPELELEERRDLDMNGGDIIAGAGSV